MKVPFDIFAAIQSADGFDILLYKEIDKGGKSKADAFVDVVLKIREYAPNWNRYSSYESWKAVKRRLVQLESGYVRVPDVIIDAHISIHGFTTLFYQKLNTSETEQEAFNKAKKEIQDYFPSYKGYSSLESYKVVKRRLKKR